MDNIRPFKLAKQLKLASNLQNLLDTVFAASDAQFERMLIENVKSEHLNSAAEICIVRIYMQSGD